MSIVGVPAQTRTIPLPTSEAGWLSVLRKETDRNYKWQEGEANELWQTWNLEPPQKTCDVHCECSLIHYLERRRRDGTPWGTIAPFNYLGVSKLSCCACHLWMAVFNEQEGREYLTKGSHGKWCFPWGMPNAGESLERGMARKLSKEYYAYLLKSGLMGLDEDSSTPPSSPLGDEDSDADEDGERVAIIETIVRESGGMEKVFSAFLD